MQKETGVPGEKPAEARLDWKHNGHTAPGSGIEPEPSSQRGGSTTTLPASHVSVMRDMMKCHQGIIWKQFIFVLTGNTLVSFDSQFILSLSCVSGFFFLGCSLQVGLLSDYNVVQKVGPFSLRSMDVALLNECKTPRSVCTKQLDQV